MSVCVPVCYVQKCRTIVFKHLRDQSERESLKEEMMKEGLQKD